MKKKKFNSKFFFFSTHDTVTLWCTCVSASKERKKENGQPKGVSASARLYVSSLILFPRASSHLCRACVL